MKKLILILAAVVVTTGYGRSPLPSDVRLHMKLEPTKFIRGGSTFEVRVFEPGTVEAKVCPPPRPNRKCVRKLSSFSESKMRKIEALIKDAYDGEEVPPALIRCRAIPMTKFDLTADNGKLLLEKGARPCGGRRYNDSPAAEKLIKILESVKRPE